ncbi:hypothetical protein CEN46_10475 [Fischerella thermalis CCMEE 5318]|uniref:Uncharacterized protein n=1 Tax=Fischerella thermalis CCMEE 5318 TaxID=2019666 RepID=A0A2N6LH85_9CYAN|nr:hypothetical protein CEN46_10475 [Fischerella thermalis CCMEE 5318]
MEKPHPQPLSLARRGVSFLDGVRLLTPLHPCFTQLEGLTHFAKPENMQVINVYTLKNYKNADKKFTSTLA